VPHGLEHNRHFWRGVVDGDGWVSPEGRVIGLVTASLLLRDQFMRFLGKAIGRRPTGKVIARNERIIAAYARGRSAYEIATREAVSAHTVYYVLNRAGITRRPWEWYARQRQRCSKGHQLDEGNTRVERNGARRCRTCAGSRPSRARARRGKLPERTESGRSRSAPHAAMSVRAAPRLARRPHRNRRPTLRSEAALAHLRPRPIGNV
jgi:DNA-binding CsgD family transcriptional regulator